jgi:transposase
MTRARVLSDEQWERIAPLLPSSHGRRGRPFRDHRQVVEGIVFRYRAGLAWRDLPREFGPWQTVWKRHHRFATDGTWDQVLRVLQAQADAAGELDWHVSVDSTVVRAHQHAATAARPRPAAEDTQDTQGAADPAGGQQSAARVLTGGSSE